MTLEEIVKQEGRQPDCSGYVTKYDIECSDGLTIRQGAFNDDNGRRVPMVWMHDHKDMENVLGHIYLESRDDGVYGYGFFNDSPKGQLGKLYVDHGDISSFSIYANKLKKKARDVVHGMIREVSLVLAGANRGAIIDSPISHSDQDEDEGEGVICMGDDYGGPIYGNDEPLSVEEYLEHYGRKGMKWGKNLFKTEYEAHPREKGEEEEETGDRKGPSEEKEKEVKKNAAAKSMNEALSKWKNTYNLYENDRGDDPEYTKKIEDQFLRDRQNLVSEVRKYVDSMELDDKETELFLDELQKKFDSDKIDLDVRRIYKDGQPAVRHIVEKLNEEKAKEALPNTPGMNAKPSEKKDEPKEEPKEELNRPKSREKKITGEGEKIKKELSRDEFVHHPEWYDDNVFNDSKWQKDYNKTGISKTGKSIVEVLNDLASYSLEYDYSSEGREQTIHHQLTYLQHAYGDVRRDETLWLPRSVTDTILQEFESYCRHTDDPKKQKLMQENIIQALKAQNLEYEFMENATRKQTIGEKASSGIKDTFDTLKDLGEKAKEKGEEVGEKAEEVLDDAKKKLKSLFKHSELTDEEAEDIIKHYISGELTMDDILEHAENEGGKTVREVFDGMSDEQQSLVFYFLKKARQLIDDGEIKYSDKEEDEMKHNVFDDAKETKENTLSHADMEKLEADVFKDAKSKGSLKDSFLAHASDYGIDDIEYLFPDDRKVTNTPTWIKRPDGWVTKVMRGVSHSPFSRIKSILADITEPDARARGYVKGNRKVEEVFGLLKRSTSPTTVYKKQKLDRDDIIDITDFDVVSWLKTEMRGMLDEELARAFLIGDGRSAASSDKINEQNIRPIYSDDDLFVIRKAIAITSSTTVDEKCKQFIRTCIKARKDYRGSGNPTLFTTEDMLTDMLLMEDQIGHTLYDSVDKLATKLRVKEIITVPVFDNQTRISGSATLELMGIIVNLDDYKVGADKGGSVSMFEDFDIDYNQEKYLIETRCSGALTVPYSAIVIESTASVYLDVEADDPTETRYGKTVSTLQSDIVINDDSISGTLNYVTGYTGYSGDTDLQSGYYIALKLDVPNGATTTIAALNNGGSGTPVDLGSDDYAVGRITTKNAKIVVSTTLAGVTVSKTYSLRLLKFGPKS